MRFEIPYIFLVRLKKVNFNLSLFYSNKKNICNAII